ncbi:hypothetical protein [Celeribacter arenosi]|uniref:VPLPA-CTERM protein sorting domain-containing protein n=1 Tax=Celeribacter arenosi TaxID=792649 RepID=A0ABP7K2S4_9RHOB
MKRLLSVLALATVVAAPASAATFSVEAFSFLSAEVSSFSFKFDDLDGDTLASIDEVYDFSGITVLGTEYTALTGLPVINGVSDGTGEHFSFETSLGGTTAVPGFLFILESAEIPAVPLPASGALLLPALGLLAFKRKRRKA